MCVYIYVCVCVYRRTTYVSRAILCDAKEILAFNDTTTQQ